MLKTKAFSLLFVVVLLFTTLCASAQGINTDTISTSHSLSLADSSQVMQKVGLSEENLGDFKQGILEKVTELTNHIAVIADKKKDLVLRNEAVTAAKKLFLSDEKIVEISSLNTTVTKKIPVRQYFSRLLNLPYYKVRITFYEIAHVSQLEKAPDGKLYGTAYIFQKFEGYDNENNLVYTDRTIKKVEVVVDQLTKSIGDQTVYIPIIRLGNINVDETKI